MNIYKKQAAEVQTLSVDFVDVLASGESVSSMTATAVDSAGTVVTTSIIHNTAVLTPVCYIVVKAGTAGTRYTITVRATSNLGNVFEEDIFLDVFADINLLSDVKTALRISSTDLDDEINDLILAAKADLQLSGLLGEKILDTDALIKRAIVVYCKANFGWDNPEADRFEKSYQMLKNHMSLSLDYAYYAVTFTIVDSSDVAIDEAEIVFDGVTKYTNSLGVAVFYVRAGNNYEYQITHEDYADYVDADGDWYNVDITASTAIDITMSDS